MSSYNSAVSVSNLNTVIPVITESSNKPMRSNKPLSTWTASNFLSLTKGGVAEASEFYEKEPIYVKKTKQNNTEKEGEGSANLKK